MPKCELGKTHAIAKKERRSWNYEQAAMLEGCLIERRLIMPESCKPSTAAVLRAASHWSADGLSQNIVAASLSGKLSLMS
jgi:hypothetical protein